MSTFVVIASVLVLYFLVNIFSVVIIDYKLDCEWWEAFFPKDLYYNTKLNMFGCIVISILFNILCGIFAIVFWILYICFYLWEGIKYIFTVGRREK